MQKYLLITLLAFQSICFAEDILEIPQEPERVFDYSDAAVLGVVQGITEYLPVSSTGHLILTNHWLGLDEDIPLLNERGEPIIINATEDTPPQLYTLKEAIDSYSLIIQGGSILAILILYWGRFLQMLRGLLGAQREGFLLARNLILAFIPAGILGFFFGETLMAHLFNPWSVVTALVLGGLVMIGIERWRAKEPLASKRFLTLSSLTPRQALVIGCCQCFAFWPGMSRSMVTIVGGYIVGLKPILAAEFSFLLGFVTLTVASTFKIFKDGNYIFQGLPEGPIIFGFILATLSSALAVKWLIRYLTRHGLEVFAYYRFILAAIVVYYLVSNGL